MQEAYQELGLKSGASPDEIRLAYRTLAKCWHPDRHAGRRTEGEALRRMQAINAAYDMLSSQFSSHPPASDKPPMAEPVRDDYAAVRALLAAMLPIEAEEMLRRIGRGDAEYHYLYALCRFRRGDRAGALRYARLAQEMDPRMPEVGPLVRKLEALQPHPSLLRRILRGNSS